MDETRVTLVFATIARPHCVQRLVRSVRQRYPRMKIAVGDQGLPQRTLSRFYEEHDVRAIFLPHDAGVSRARNAAVSQVDTEFVLLADDDFIIGPETDISIPLSILAGDRSVDIIGGLLYDIYGEIDFTKGHPRRWERMFFTDTEKELFVALPMDMFFPIEKRAGGHSYFRCDAVMNWALMRTKIFQRGATWDERYTCNGEHEDFYLNIKQNTDIKVAYCSDFVAFHHHPPDFRYFDKRERQEGWTRFGEKWGFKQYQNHPWGLQKFATGVQVYPEAKSLEDFLARSPAYVAPRAFLGANIDPDGSVCIPKREGPQNKVSVFVSNSGSIRLIENENATSSPSYVVTKFSLQDLIDVRKISVHLFDESRSQTLTKGQPINFQMTVRNEGPPIGVGNGLHKIAAGMRIRTESGELLPFAENHLTPLVNDLNRDSFQYISTTLDLPVGRYLVAIDLWVDSLGWLQRADRTELWIVDNELTQVTPQTAE
ncbi:MAG: glycosyltransferase [Proteobacteria bacterium]|nr:glycosyltransferase [Pseudomonadota bacterium]